MKEELIKLDTAVLAKEKGFNWEVAHAFVNTELTEDVNTEDNSVSTHFIGKLNHNKKDHRVSRPSQSLLQRWLREVHGLFISIRLDNGLFIGSIVKNDGAGTVFDITQKATYETALEVALQTALKLIV